MWILVKIDENVYVKKRFTTNYNNISYIVIPIKFVNTDILVTSLNKTLFDVLYLLQQTTIPIHIKIVNATITDYNRFDLLETIKTFIEIHKMNISVTLSTNKFIKLFGQKWKKIYENTTLANVFRHKIYDCNL